MKKLTALILTLSMLLGMFAIPMGASAIEVDEREAILNAKTYDYVEFEKTRDYFALYQEAADYGRFNQSADESTSTTVTADKIDYTYTDPTTGETVTKNIYNWYPDTTYSGEEITLNEAMYSKGFANYLSATLKNAGYVFLMDDIINPNGSSYSAWRWPAGSNTNTHHNGATYNGTLKRTEVKFTVSNTQKLSGPDENGNYIFGYGDAQFKVGPIIPDRQLHKNGRVLGSSYEVKNLDNTAKSLDLLILNSHVNTNLTASKFAVGRGPSAALQKVQVKYEGETNPVNKWVVVTDNAVLSYGAAYSTNPVEKMIVYAPKYETNEAGEKVEIDYANNGSWMYNSTENHGFKWLKGNSTGVVDSMPTVEDVKFVNDDIIVGKAGRVAQKVGTRQDTLNQSAGADADVISIPLEDKKVTSVKFEVSSYVEGIDTAIYIPSNGTSTQYKAALVPVEINNVNASEEYVYFAFVGPTVSGTSLLGMTFAGESLKDKIDALNNVLSALDSAALTEADIANYRAQIAELKAKSEYILDSDFDTAKLEEAEERIVDEKAEAFVNEPAKVNFPISEATGANSKMFLAKGSLGDNVGDNYSDYLPLLDHNGTTTRYTDATAATAGYTSGLGYYPTGTKADTVNNYGAIFYTIDGTTDNTKGNEVLNFAAKNGQTYWNINGVDYNVDPTNKIIKILGGVHTDLIADEELAAKYKTLGNLTFDVVDGYYDNIGFLVGTNSTSARTFKYKLVYEDGTTSTITSPGILNSSSDSATYRVAQGYIYHRMFNPTSSGVNRNASRGHRYVPVEVDTDVTRKLKEIQLIGSDTWTAFYIVSAWGNAEPIATKLAVLETMEVVDEESCVAAKNAIADFDAYLAVLGYTLDDLGSYKAPYVDLKAEITEFYGTLKLKTNLPISEANGANAKLFIESDTFNTYKANQAVSEEWINGLDFAGVVNYYYSSTNKDHTSFPTGTDADTTSSKNNALIFKVDQAPVANPVKYNVPFVNLTTKNGLPTWTVNGTDFAINPYEKVVKVYTPTDASGVEDAELKERFASLNNPVLDIKDGCYESITVLAGANGKRTLTPTVIYKDGTSKKLSSTITADNTYVEGDSQDTGFQYLQALTNWGNLNQGGAAKFGAITLTGFDTSKVIDKISFKSDGWGNPIFVLSAFGETATIEEVLNSADASDLVKAKAALDTVDAILAGNNVTADDLSDELLAKYNELKEATAAFLIEEITLAEGVATVKYVNTTSVDEKAVLIVAQYNADETELISVKYQPVTFEKGKTELTANVEVNSANKIKVFVWKDLVDFFPLTANIFGK